jgi:hypothetical protein
MKVWQTKQAKELRVDRDNAREPESGERAAVVGDLLY